MSLFVFLVDVAAFAAIVAVIVAAAVIAVDVVVVIVAVVKKEFDSIGVVLRPLFILAPTRAGATTTTTT